MKYDFDTIIPRRGTNSYKWDTPEEENVLPMWVADMDFRTAPAYYRCLTKAGGARYFGYTKVPEAYYDAVVRWFDDRHRWQVDSRWIIYTSGVVPALSAIIKALAMPGDKVIVQTPAYNCFYSSIRNDGCELFANNLVYQDGRYVIDFADLEGKLPIRKQKSCCCAILTILPEGCGNVKNWYVLVKFVFDTMLRSFRMRFIANWFFQSTVTHRLLPSQKISVTIL